MLHGRLPVSVDPVRFCEAGRELSGSLPLSQMGRLAPLLRSPEGDVEVELVFGRDHEGYCVIKGQIRTEVELVCQRCLEPFRLPLGAQLLLAVVANQAQAEQLPERYDPVLLEDDGLFLRDLIEDELLLALPGVAKHPDGACAIAVPPEEVTEESRRADEIPGETDGETRVNPFAALKTLKD